MSEYSRAGVRHENKDRGLAGHARQLRGTIANNPRAKVAGVLRFKRKVELLVSESATVGPVEGATPVMFSTEEPPAAVIKD